MKDDRWPVILEGSFRENVASGWAVLLLCTRNAEKGSNTWHGQWQVHCVSPDRLKRAVLIFHKHHKPRVILTVTGVTSFLMDLGFTISAVPLARGDTVEITHDRRVLWDRDAI